ncbi:MAG: flagellar basal body rod protein FlgC, partial [Ruminiclostridium sp.]|nr:flagellar basal body rod protein FlgC [Ruminiclostridium sp.]
MSFLSCLDIPTSGMSAQRLRAEIIEQNVANATTTRTSDGTPYVRQLTVFSEEKAYDNLDIMGFINKNTHTLMRGDSTFGSVLEMTLRERNAYTGTGVVVSSIERDPTPLTPVYDPSHPDADENGYYYLPNVDVAEEELDFVAATNSYNANVTIFNSMKKMLQKALT